MIEVHFLGTGGSKASAQRDNTALLLKLQERFMLVDCSGSPLKRIKSLGFDLADLRGLFITHQHPDHIYGLVSLIHSFHGQRFDLPIWGPAKALDMVVKMLHLHNLDDTAKYPKLIYNPVTVDDVRVFKEGEDYKLESFPVQHGTDCTGIRITTDGRTCVFTSDTGIADSTRTVADHADVLIHDCAAPQRFRDEIGYEHTCAGDLGRFAAELEVGNLIPAHLFTDFDYEIDEIFTDIRKEFNGTVTIPSDGDVVMVG